MDRQGSLLSWLSIRIGLQGRKPGESNKLFDPFLPPQDLSVLSVVRTPLSSGVPPSSSPRGLSCFCLMTLVTTGLIRSIRLIRGKEETSRGWGISVFVLLR